MHKGPVDNRHTLQKIRQHLTQVVTILERHVRRQDNIRLNEKLIACMVCPEVLDLADRCGESHREVKEEVSFVRLGREASKVPNVVSRSLAPIEDDHKREQETSQGIEPPDTSIVPDCTRISMFQ